MEISLSPGRLMGAFNAGVADGAWGDLPMPMLSNPRVRFWFSERGWRAYGLRVAAAIDTIAELGYGQASLARIAETAGTSKGVIIYHFGGKDELIRELVAELVARGVAYMEPQIDAEPTGAGKLRAYIESNLA